MTARQGACADSMSLDAIATPGGPRAGSLSDPLPQSDGGEGGLDRYLELCGESGCDLPVCVLEGVLDEPCDRSGSAFSRPRLLPNCDVFSAGRRADVDRCRGAGRGRRRADGVVAGSPGRVHGCRGWPLRGAGAGSRRWRAGGWVSVRSVGSGAGRAAGGPRLWQELAGGEEHRAGGLRTWVRRLRQGGKNIGADVEPAPLLAGLREHLAQRGPESQRPVPGGQHRGAHATTATARGTRRRARPVPYSRRCSARRRAPMTSDGVTNASSTSWDCPSLVPKVNATAVPPKTRHRRRDRDGGADTSTAPG